jgi:hypothetical protein
MPYLRLAYATLYLIALIAVFVLWSQVGGQSHLDLMAWYLKLGLGGGAAFAVVKAAAAAVSQEHAWNGRTLRWLGILLVLLIGCGLASYYCHLYLEDEGDDSQDTPASVGRVAPEGSGAVAGGALRYELSLSLPGSGSGTGRLLLAAVSADKKSDGPTASNSDLSFVPALCAASAGATLELPNVRARAGLDKSQHSGAAAGS